MQNNSMTRQDISALEVARFIFNPDLFVRLDVQEMMEFEKDLLLLVMIAASLNNSEMIGIKMSMEKKAQKQARMASWKANSTVGPWSVHKTMLEALERLLINAYLADRGRDSPYGLHE